MIAVIDYGVGNLFSLCSSLDAIGAESIVTSDPETVRAADKIILPGVGAFSDAIAKLREAGDKIKETPEMIAAKKAEEEKAAAEKAEADAKAAKEAEEIVAARRAQAETAELLRDIKALIEKK